MANATTPLKLLREALDRKMETFKRLQSERTHHEGKLQENLRMSEEMSDDIDQLVDAIMILGGADDFSPSP